MKHLLIVAIVALSFIGCQSNEPNPELEALKLEKEAIAREAAAKDSTINSFIESLNEIEDNLAQVKQKQGAIKSSATEGAELQGTAKDRINEDINFINDLLDENKSKLASLQSRLKKSNVKVGELEKMIERMTAQLAEKDLEIGSLKEQLAAMNIQITELTTAVGGLQSESAAKTNVIEQKTEALNTAYYAVGTYKELRDNKVVSKEGGFLGLGRKKSLVGDFNEEYFNKIDVSQIKSIPIGGKDAKVVTNHPSSSYKLEMEGKKMVKSLTITNPSSFWRSSKYLVVIVDK
ncbi:MAG: hypothetical protein WED33_10155 [Bacteroidia bacterium]